jgi:magnesium chelatase subunit I
MGKLEMESFSLDGREDKLINHLINTAVKQTFDEHFDVNSLGEVVKAFQDGATALVSDSLASEDYLKQFSGVEAIGAAAQSVCPKYSPAIFASVAEFILEGLYLHRQIHKESLGGKMRYKG